MTGFEINDNGAGNPNPNGAVTIYCVDDGSTPFRFDNNKIDHVNGFGMVTWNVRGVIDHNVFLGGSPSQIAIYIYHGGADGFGDASWTNPVTWGSSEFLFIEDNSFAYDTPLLYCTDGFRGTRAVYRFNTASNCSFGVHGTESSGRNRGSRAVENYKNTFSTTDVFMSIRSGSGLIWGNTGTGSIPANAVNVVVDRTVFAFYQFGAATGSNLWDVNANGGVPVRTYSASGGGQFTVTVTGAGWTPNQWAKYTINKTAACGWPNQCTSVIISNTADTLTYAGANAFGTDMRFAAGEGFNITKVTYALDQPGRGGGVLLTGDAPAPPAGGMNQINFPIYEWQNTMNGSNVHVGVQATCYGVCVENEHFYAYTPSFNGTVGVGSGPGANRPGTCTVGVWYWATDEGEWWAAKAGADGRAYKCVTPNVWSLVYTPYTYPHPLTTASGNGDTTAPTVSLSILP